MLRSFKTLFARRFLCASAYTSLLVASATSIQAQQPSRWTNDFGVSARQPGLGTASLGTDGARFSGRLGQSPVTASVGTAGENVGVEHCGDFYPIPTHVGRVGARICGQASLNGFTGTITPGVQLHSGTQVGAYYRFNYNPLADSPSALTPAPSQPSAPSNTLSDDQVLQLLRERAAEREMQRQRDEQIAAALAGNPYNPPAEFAFQPTSPESVIVEDPPMQHSPSPGMSEAEFRAVVAQQMQRFHETEAEHRRQLAQREIPPASSEHRTPPIGDVPPAGVRPSVRYEDYAPRNGYDPQGNRTDSTRHRYDADGNSAAPAPAPYSTAISNTDADDFWYSQSNQTQYVPQRQNRVYNGYTGTSRPIGSGRSTAAQQYAAMQRWSNNQIAAINAQRYNDAYDSTQSASGYSTDSTTTGAAAGNVSSAAATSATGFGYDNSPRRGSQIIYDDQVTRESGQVVVDENARSSGTSSSVLDEPAQRPISSPVYDHRPGQSGIVQEADQTPISVTPRSLGQSADTAALR